MKTPLRTPTEKYQHREISRQETITCADLGYFKNPEGRTVHECNERIFKRNMNVQKQWDELFNNKQSK